MSREAVATALDEAAEALARAAHALRGMEPASREAVPAPSGAAVAGGGGVPQVNPPPAPAPAPTTALGMCPIHRVAWVVKDGGISKNGKPYKAFWKCKERDENGYCNERPTKAWADSHPIPVRAVEEVPF